MKQGVAEFIVKRRAWFAAASLIVALLLGPFASQMDKLEVGGSAIGGSEAEQVQDILLTEFDAPFSVSMILLLSGMPPLDQDAGVDILVDVVDAVTELDNVSAVFSYLNTLDPVFMGADGTFVLVGLATGERRMDEVVVDLRARTASLAAEFRQDMPDFDLAWTGGPAFDYDIRLTSAEDAAAAERLVMPVALVLLLIIFGSLAAALCPIAIAGLGVTISLGAAVLVSAYWPMTVLLQNIVSMIGLGIGIDYTLLMISRFREEIRNGCGPESAAIVALRTAGHTIFLSGVAVAIGFGALLLIPAKELRSIAVGGLLVVGFSVGLATLLLPALLTWIGSRLEAGRHRFPSKRFVSETRWRAWGRFVVGHPLRILILVGLPLIALAWQVRNISTDIPSANWLPERMESTRGAMALHGFGQSGIIQTMRVVIEFPDGVDADSVPAWEVLFALGHVFESDQRVARVVSLPKLLGVEDAEQASIAFVTDELRGMYISRDRKRALLELIPTEEASVGSLTRYVRQLRGPDMAARSGLPGTRLLVGGLPALNADYQDAIGGSVLKVITFIGIGSFFALLAGFRSVLAAAKALALNLLSVAAAMGVTVIVFQYGFGSAWLGVAEPLDGLFPAVPIIVFCVVFGLSMDYEVFLLARVAEAVRNGATDDDAIVDGLANTGRVIASAALLMIVVFSGFSLGDFLIIKILGFSLAAAILIDATVVRLALGPALLKLGGRWNWWPGGRGSPRSVSGSRRR